MQVFPALHFLLSSMEIGSEHARTTAVRLGIDFALDAPRPGVQSQCTSLGTSATIRTRMRMRSYGIRSPVSPLQDYTRIIGFTT
jgi:hypothetical protein